MIKAEGLAGEFIKGGLDFEILPGTKRVFTFSTEEEREEFLEIITGIKRPLKGSISIMDRRPEGLSREELLALRRHIGVVFREGGLISNLRAWENLVLPALYHGVGPPERIKEMGIRILKEMGFKRLPFTRIADLTPFEKVMIGLGRAILLNPSVLVLYCTFEGLQDTERKEILSIIKRFLPDGAIIYIGGSSGGEVTVRETMELMEGC